MHDLHKHINNVLAQISEYATHYQRQPDSVHLLAVSKKHPAAMIREAYQYGLRRFGENYLQEALEKMHQLADLDIEWHFIGPIQSNKTREIASHFDWVHSVDRLKIARRLNEQRPDNLPPVNICLQINISHESSKSGMSLDELDDICENISHMQRISLRGLMAVPAATESLEQQRLPFRVLRLRLQDLQNKYPHMDTLSMGMTNDMQAAIAEGANLIRIGTGIFGARPA
jgi:pyridoxal phosphate enzyme (YggS family)